MLGHAPVQVPVRDLFRGLLDFDQRLQVRPHHREPTIISTNRITTLTITSA